MVTELKQTLSLNLFVVLRKDTLPTLCLMIRSWMRLYTKATWHRGFVHGSYCKQTLIGYIWICIVFKLNYILSVSVILSATSVSPSLPFSRSYSHSHSLHPSLNQHHTTIPSSHLPKSSFIFSFFLLLCLVCPPLPLPLLYLPIHFLLPLHSSSLLPS